MNAKQTYFVMIGLVVLLGLGLFAGAYFSNSLLQAQSQKLVTLKAKEDGLNQQQTDLNTDKKNITKYTSLYNIAKIVVPENKDQAETVRQIVNIASANSISLDSITFPSSSLGGNTTTAAPGVVSSVNSTGSALSQLTSVPNIAGVYSLQLSVASASETTRLATYPELISFLNALENNRLTALVSSIDIVPNAQNHTLLSFTLNMNIYIKPGS